MSAGVTAWAAFHHELDQAEAGERVAVVRNYFHDRQQGAS